MKVVIWDVDDVLNDLMGEWLKRSWRKMNPNCSLEYPMLTRNPPHELLGVPKGQYLDSLDAFRQNHFMDLKPLPEMQDWFHSYGHKARHIAVTSVPLKASHLSASWVFSHFGRWIRSFHVVPSPRPGDLSETGNPTKAEFIYAFSKADLVVEDNPETITSLRQKGINTLTVPRPWNRSAETVGDTLAKLSHFIAK